MQKKKQIGLRLTPEDRYDVRAMSLAWNCSQQAVCEQAIKSFLAFEQASVVAGRKLLDNIERSAKRFNSAQKT